MVPTGLLFLATTLNYMDRISLNQMAVQIQKALNLVRRLSMLPGASKSSKLRGSVEGLDAMDAVDVVTGVVRAVSRAAAGRSQLRRAATAAEMMVANLRTLAR